MTTLEKFMEFDNKTRESFLGALYLFNELDAEYRQRMKQANFNADAWKVDVDQQLTKERAS